MTNEPCSCTLLDRYRDAASGSMNSRHANSSNRCPQVGFPSIRVLAVILTAFSGSAMADERVFLNNFPDFRQPDFVTCGPTAASMLLKYYGTDAGILPLTTRAGTHWFDFSRVLPNSKFGMTKPNGLTSAIQSYRLAVQQQKGSIEDLKVLVKANRPPIILVRSGDTKWHYLVIIGYSPVTFSPFLGPRGMQDFCKLAF